MSDQTENPGSGGNAVLAPDDAEIASGGAGPWTTEEQTMSDDDRSLFQDHWDEFPGH